MAAVLEAAGEPADELRHERDEILEGLGVVSIPEVPLLEPSTA